MGLPYEVKPCPLASIDTITFRLRPRAKFEGGVWWRLDGNSKKQTAAFEYRFSNPTESIALLSPPAYVLFVGRVRTTTRACPRNKPVLCVYLEKNDHPPAAVVPHLISFHAAYERRPRPNFSSPCQPTLCFYPLMPAST